MTPPLTTGVCEATKEGFKALIYTLRLIIGLRVVCCTQAEFCTSVSKPFLPKVAGEHQITIRDDGVGKAMDRIDALHI